VQPLGRFPAFYGTQRFIQVKTINHILSLNKLLSSRTGGGLCELYNDVDSHWLPDLFALKFTTATDYMVSSSGAALVNPIFK
jgi:hypothetical protein